LVEVRDERSCRLIRDVLSYIRKKPPIVSRLFIPSKVVNEGLLNTFRSTPIVSRLSSPIKLSRLVYCTNRSSPMVVRFSNPEKFTNWGLSSKKILPPISIRLINPSKLTIESHE